MPTWPVSVMCWLVGERMDGLGGMDGMDGCVRCLRGCN